MGLPQIPVPTLETARKPERLYEFLRLFSDAVRRLELNPEGTPEVFQLTPALIMEIREELQVNGLAPLNVNGLIGLLSQPQTAAVVVAASQPNAANYLPGTMLVVTGTPDTFYYNKSGNPNTWQAISTTPTNMMTLDTAQTVTAAGIKTIDATWLFEVDQNMIHGLNSNLIFTVQNTNNTGTAAAGVIRARGDAANLSVIGHGTGRTTVRCGVTLGGWNELFGVAGSGMLIDMTGNFPIVFGTNSTERLRVDGAGLTTFITPGKCILVKPSSAPAANTLMLELQSSAAASLWSVDVEGDMIANSLKVVSPAANAILIQPSSASGGSKLFVIKDTGGTEAVSMRDSGQTNFTGSGAAVIVDSSGVAGAVVLEVKQSGTQRFAVTNEGQVQCDLDLQADGGIKVGSGTTLTKIVKYSTSLTPSAVGANSTSEQTFTVNGLTTSDTVTLPNKAAHQSGLGIVGARVSAADTLAITFVNVTAGSITPTASENYKFVAFRS